MRWRDVLIGHEIGQELLGRKAENVVDQEPIASSIHEQAAALGVIGAKGLETAEIPASHVRRVLDLDRPETVPAVHDEIDLDACPGPPVEELAVPAGVGDPGTKVLGDKTLEGGAVDLLGSIERFVRAT